MSVALRTSGVEQSYNVLRLQQYPVIDYRRVRSIPKISPQSTGHGTGTSSILTVIGAPDTPGSEKAVAESKRPTLIIGNHHGQGAVDANNASFENKVSTHGQPLSAAGADIKATITNLGGDPENPFAIFEETRELYAKRRTELEKWSRTIEKTEKEWRKANKELSLKLDLFLSGKTVELYLSALRIKENQATRVASASVLELLADKVENMIVASADLSNSDKTDGSSKRPKRSLKVILRKLPADGGIRTHYGMYYERFGAPWRCDSACGTFFVFSDYMKPAIRLSALMRLPVVYIWSHDSFGG